MDSISQTTVSGTVFDSTKLYVVPKVEVFNTSGNKTITDSLGKYMIAVTPNDSLYFYYNNKFTLKFPVKDMKKPDAFDISLLVKVDEKYKLLKGITVYSENYKKDSLENRLTYSKIFDNKGASLKTTYDPGGPAGIDLESLIGIFQFRKNRLQRDFRDRLLDEEQDRYVDYRFSSRIITRITGLKGDNLIEYKKLYRPNYYFATNSSLTQFYEYILNTSYKYKKEKNIED
ncbi:MAG: hypothetical protein ABI123_03930 [Ginsengibacter sp.]